MKVGGQGIVHKVKLGEGSRLGSRSGSRFGVKVWGQGQGSRSWGQGQGHDRWSQGRRSRSVVKVRV